MSEFQNSGAFSRVLVGSGVRCSGFKSRRWARSTAVLLFENSAEEFERTAVWRALSPCSEVTGAWRRTGVCGDVMKRGMRDLSQLGVSSKIFFSLGVCNSMGGVWKSVAQSIYRRERGGGGVFLARRRGPCSSLRTGNLKKLVVTTSP